MGTTQDTEQRQEVAHLLRRAGFGGRATEVDAALGAGYEATVAALVRPSATDAGATATPPPSLSPPARRSKDQSPAVQKAANTAIGQEFRTLVAWWMDRMVAVQSPFTEKRTWFWHGHFATAESKVRDPAFMLGQNQTLRQLGGGDFQALTTAIVQDPAMMIWLDAVGNTRSAPNENLGRELMELFTLGVGNYTENDVRAAARALTGWGLDYATGKPVFHPQAHDPGPETILGQTGSLDAASLVQLLVNTPASRTFVVTKAWNNFAAPGPVPSDVMARLQGAYGPNRDLSALFQALFLDPVFRGPTCRYALVKQPVEYIVGTLKLLGPTTGAATGTTGGDNAGPGADAMQAVLTGLGQVPFNPPNVGGWPSGSAWLTTGAVEAKQRFAQLIAADADLSAITSTPASGRLAATADLLGLDTWTSRTAAALTPLVADPAGLVATALVSAEYQLN